MAVVVCRQRDDLLFGAIAYEFGKWVLPELSLPDWITPAFPLAGFLIHGLWMLWVTAPEATAHLTTPAASPPRDNDPDTLPS